MNITGSKTTDFSVTVPDNITGSRTEEKEVKKKNVYVAETNSLITVPEDYTPAQQISAARQEEFEKINEYTDSQKFWNKYVFDPTKSTGRFAKTLLKSAANQTVDLTGGSLLRLEEWAENTGAEIAYDVAKEKGMDYPGALLELRKDAVERNRNLLDKAMFNIGEEESEIAQNLGSGAVSIGSMFLAWGLGNKRFALDLAKIFGLSSGTSMYENLTLAGAPYDTATYRGAVAGISEYALEKAGFEWVTNRIQNRLLYPITKRFIEPGFAGAVQESLQEGKDILLEEGYIESTPEEKFDRLSTAAIYGAILETAGANVGYELYRRRMRENLRQAAIEDGYDTKTADKMAKAATPSTNEMLNILRDEERRTLDGLEKFTPEQMEEYEKSLELTRNLPTEDAAAEVQFYDGLKNVILKGGIEENEARRQAAYWSLMVKNDYELAKESGTYQGNMAEFQRDWLNLNVANRKNMRAVKAGNRVVETPVRMTEDEISEAWAARQQERQMSDEERYREESQRGVLFSKENLTTREDGFPVADDNDTVDVVTLPEGSVPDFKTKRELVTFIKNILGNERNITIKSTGDTVLVSNAGINRAAVKTRRSEYNEVFGAVRQLLENAKYSGFVNADERHSNVRGQDVYHSGLVIGSRPYSVMFKVDIPLEEGSHNYAGHKISDIQIAPSENANGYFNSPHTEDAIRNITLAVLRGKVNPARQENGKLFQKAYAGSRVDYEKPSLEAIGSGEGNQAHGWGLYYALNKDVAEEYRKNFVTESDEYNYEYNIARLEQIEELGQKKAIEYYTNKFNEAQKALNRFNSEHTKQEIMYDDYLLMEQSDLQAEVENTKYDLDYAKNYKSGQVHEVDIPENPYLLDEQKPFSEQSEFVKDAIRKLNNEAVNDILDDDITGEDIYGELVNDVSKNIDADDLRTKTNMAQKVASQLLEKVGIKGITYNGKQDGRAFVIFNPDDVQVIQKFYSRTGETVRGTYDPSERLIELFADTKPDTLTHELSHHFFMNHFRVAQEYGFSEYDRGVMKWLSKQGKHEIKGFADMQGQDWENLTEAFIRYLNTGNAPTIATRGIFQKAKEWVLGVYDINRDYASSEVKDFFDALVSREGEIPNIDNIIQNKADFEEAVKRALRGEGATFRGQSIKDIRALRKATNTRIRRPGKTLVQELRALGYRIDNVNRTLVDEKGVVEDARLAEILQELGVLDNVATETYEQTEALSSKMQEILSNADTTYSPREARIRQERETSVANQAKAQQFIDELLKDNQLGIKTIEELDEMLARILSKPDNTDIVKVNRDAIKYLQAKNAEMNKNYREAIRQVKQAEKVRRETQYQLQSRIKDFIRGLPVTGDHKAALMGNIQRVKDADSFEKVLADVRMRAAGYIEQEQKQLNRNIINDILRRSKPKERKKQNFNYEHNKLFEELREYNKLTQEQAKEKLQAIYETLDEEISPAEMIKRSFIQYKATGLKSSSDVLEALARDLSSLYNDAINERLDTLEKKGKERNAKIESLLNYIKGTKKVNKADQLLLKFTNLESNMAELFGKEWAEQHEMETVLLHQEIEQSKKINSALDEAKSIYGVEKKSDFTKLMAEKSQENDDWVLYGINGAAEGSQEKMSTMKLVDLYLGAKNPRTREQLNYLYEQFDREGNQITTQIDDMLGYLDEKDKAFGDMLQRRVNERYEAENKIYVKLYGIDMPKQESYWMRSSHKSERELMDVKKFMDIDALPGFMKERAKTPFIYPENAWKKFASRMVDSVYMTEVFEKYKDIYDIVHSNRIKNAIINKYDDKRYESLNQSLKEISLGGVSKNYNEIENIINKAISNWVVSKISISDSVFVKQLASFTNYAENMPVLEFVQGVGEFLANPAKAIKFMREFDGEFLDYRLSSGMQNEVLSKIISDSGKGYSRYSNLYQAYLEKITIPVRYGDVGAIYLGGYARVKNLLKEGKSLEEARKIFEHETLRAQQSGNPASTATFQKNPIFRLFTAFKNTQLQYLRKLQDSAIQYRRGEISGAQLGKIWGNYMFIQSILYQLLTNLWGYLWNDDDEELKLWEDVWMRVFISPIGGLPVLGDVAEGMFGERFYGLNIPARQDIERFITAFRSVMDGEIDAKKIGKGMLGVIELGMPLPDKVLRKLMDYLLDD